VDVSQITNRTGDDIRISVLSSQELIVFYCDLKKPFRELLNRFDWFRPLNP